MTTKSSTTRRVGDDELPEDWEEANYSSGDEDVVCRVEEEDRKWPGTLQERRAFSKEIIDNTLHYLHGVFGRDKPSKSMFLCVYKL